MHTDVHVHTGFSFKSRLCLTHQTRNAVCGCVLNMVKVSIKVGGTIPNPASNSCLGWLYCMLSRRGYGKAETDKATDVLVVFLVAYSYSADLKK